MNEVEVGKLKEASELSYGHEEAFRDVLGIDPTLIEELKIRGFFTDPASSKYHGAWKGGLAQHSLRVLFHTIRLFGSFCPNTDTSSLLFGAVFHDLVKVGSYEITTRNVKKNNQWVQEPYYMNKEVVTMGHGSESCRRIQALGIELTEGWYQAVRWHMGGFDCSEMDKYALMAAQKAHPEVLLLQTADLLAGIQEGI